MTAVVTGAAGHVGATLVRGLLADGWPVRAVVHHDRRGLEGLELELAQGDVCVPPTLDRAFEGAEIVYHAAARISLLWNEWERLEAVNVVGTRNVVDACLRNSVRRLIHFSSADVFESFSVAVISTLPDVILIFSPIARPLRYRRTCDPSCRVWCAGSRGPPRAAARPAAAARTSL